MTADNDELELLRACSELDRATDDAIEQATQTRQPLAVAVATLLPILCRHAGAEAAWLRTIDEDLTERDFHWPSSGSGIDGDRVVADTNARRSHIQIGDGSAVVGQHLDVAGEIFGGAAVRLTRTLDPGSTIRTQRLLDVWCEELDNFLAAIALARRKHRVVGSIARGLRDPVLERGIHTAIAALSDEVRFDDLLLVYCQEDDHEGASLNYLVINDGQTVLDSLHRASRADAATLEHLVALVRGQDPAAASSFGIRDYREEVLISGLDEQQIVGRLLIANRTRDFNTYDRDLLERFADHLRQRIVDFNRQWKMLSHYFARETVIRLLSEEDHVERYLRPRKRDVAVLYCDISGFTRLSEQVLREPELIGQLVDTWSARVVDLIWDTGGVFDKMVGDCIIGLWGPPFFDLEPAEWCRRAADAARRIREYTSHLDKDLPALRGVDVDFGVATGLNYCPMFVGLFGPNEDFTGFSSGMNNTARLQGVATQDEILCMDAFVAALGDPESFGEERQATVKNVAAPIRFRPLRS